MKYVELEAVRDRLEEFLAQVLFPALNRHQQRHWGSAFVRGFLLDGERKSAGALAERLPDGNEQAMQQFLTDSVWDFRAVRRRLAQQMEPLLPAQSAVWVHDDTGFPKKGKHSVGVARQYSGTLGKVGNCQIGVSMHLAAPAGSLPLDWELYLPEEWAEDPERCRKAGIPGEVTKRAKWQLALDLTDRVLSWKLQPQIVTADAAYGSVAEYRDGLALRQLKYVVGIRSNVGVWVGEVPATPPQPNGKGRPRTRYDYGEHRPATVLEAAKSLPQTSWQEVVWDQGSKGPLRSRFAALRVHTSQGYHEGKPPRLAEWLIIEWPQGEEAPTDFWLSNESEQTDLRDLVRLGKMRWHIEQDYQQLKEELGLDHFEGRSESVGTAM
jgi:SRSO17 transposase